MLYTQAENIDIGSHGKNSVTYKPQRELAPSSINTDSNYSQYTTLIMFSLQLAHVDELFISDSRQATPIGALCENFKDIGQKLLNHYVRIQGQVISQVSLLLITLSKTAACPV